MKLEIHETTDEAADQRRLAAIMRVINAWPGTEPVTLRMHTVQGEVIDVALPSVSMGLEPHLRQVEKLAASYSG